MERKVIPQPIEKVYKDRANYFQADYQRNPTLWQLGAKQLLIDSILTDIDIPKLYLNEIGNNQYEIVDGQQRLYAIWEFIDNLYKLKSTNLTELNGKYFADLPAKYRKVILEYKLQFVVIKNADDEYLRQLFLRLQLGLLLVAGEKLNAETGQMRNFIFNKMVKRSFIKNITIPNRRYAKQALCAQICINSFNKVKLQTFCRTRYDDLRFFFRDYKNVKGSDKMFFDDRCTHIINILKILNTYFKDDAKKLRNRSLILSIYLFIEEQFEQSKDVFKKDMPIFVSFIKRLLIRLKEEAKLGIRRKNEDLYRMESYLSNAPGEKYQITNRHNMLKVLFEYYKNNKKIKGD